MVASSDASGAPFRLGLRCAKDASLSHGSADHHVDLMAPAAGTHEPLSPIEHGRSGAVPSGHLSRIWLGLMLTSLAPDNQPGVGRGCVPSVIGGPGSDFTCGVAAPGAGPVRGRALLVSAASREVATAGLPATLRGLGATFGCATTGESDRFR